MLTVILMKSMTGIVTKLWILPSVFDMYTYFPCKCTQNWINNSTLSSHIHIRYYFFKSMKTYRQSSSESTMLSGPGLWAFPLARNWRNDLGFSPATWGTASTSFFWSDCSRRNVSSSRGAIHPMLPSRVPNSKANLFVLSDPRVSVVGSICSLKNLETRDPTWNSALDRSFCPFQLSDIFGA